MCPECRQYKKYIPYEDYAITRDFYKDPNLDRLRLGYNFLTVKPVYSVLKACKVPVSYYTLKYILYNREKFLDYTMARFTKEYVFRYQNRKFFLVFYSAIQDEAIREYYKSMNEDITAGISPKQLYLKYKISYESMFYLCKYLRTNVLDW